MDSMICRFCNSSLEHTFADLGLSPLANAYVSYEYSKRETFFYPLYAKVCSRCFLVQAEAFSSPEQMFNDYKYFSSNSKSWLKHTKDYVQMVTGRLNLDANTLVVEIASNDGYLLQYFNEAGVPNYGVEPAHDAARKARVKGIEVVCEYFGDRLACQLSAEKGKVDLLIGNNVLAHVPDINDFVTGMKTLLKPAGTITMEFPHLLNLIKQVQFDTIYHEHFSYFSLNTVAEIFLKHGLMIYDVERLETHGGSLRIYATHADNGFKINSSVDDLKKEETDYGLRDLGIYTQFQAKINHIKYTSISKLSSIKLEGKSIIAYGAAAKGTTFLNYCGIGKDYFEYIVDVTPEKQGLFLPGTLIPIVDESYIERLKPDYIAILPWNWKEEIINRLSFTREWGCKFITFIPELAID